MTRTFKLSALCGLSAFALAACGGEDAATGPEMGTDATAADGAVMETAAAKDMAEDMASDAGDAMAMAAMTLGDAVANVAMRGEDMARDGARNPLETLTFFGIEPDMTVIEIYPGGGWYTKIIAPFIMAGNGTYVAAGASDRFRERFSEAAVTGFGADSAPLVEPGTADMVLTFRNVHNWVMGGFEEKAFSDFYEALKPGGILGVVEHRLPEAADDSMEKTSGYVKQSSVIALAEAAGFTLVDTSDVNANPNDTADHPFGVWTLPPRSRTEGRDGSAPEGFDPAPYLAIGESDRMTLKFMKPVDADAALLE